MNTTYFRVRLSLVPRPQEQEITTFCFAHQALGISEVLNFSQPDLTYDPSLIPRRLLELDIFFEAKPKAEFFSELLKINSQIIMLENEEETKDWLAEWKKGFNAFKLVGPVWVVHLGLKNPLM